MDLEGFTNRVKSGNFGHQVNSDIYLQTEEIQMRRLLMSRLIRILPDFTLSIITRLYPKYYFSKNTMADDNTLIKIEIETQTTESDLIRNNESDGNRCFWLVYSY